MSHAPLWLTAPLALLLLALAVPAAVAAWQGARGRLRRGGRLGLHTPAAASSERSFALANRVSAPLVAGAAAVGAVCAGLVLLLPLGVVGAIVVAVVGAAGVLWQLAMASRLGEAAAGTLPRPARAPAGCCGAGGCGCGAHGAGAGAGSGALPDLVADGTTRQVL